MPDRNVSPRRMAQPKQNTFFGGAAILAVGIMVVKVIGLFYKIPLINIIGEQGSADFNNAYNIYAVLLTVSTAGLPVAVSKLVSEANAMNRGNQVKKVFRLSLTAFLTLGMLSFTLMYFGSVQLANLMNDSMAAAGIRALAPAVICVGCLSAFRGYAQGHGDMAPTAISQVLEALCKLVVGLGLAYWLIHAGQPTHVAAAGAITGVTVGTILALAYMVLHFITTRLRDTTLCQDVPDGGGRILSELLKIAIPITISSSMVGIVTVIDASLVQGQLQNALLMTEDASRTLYGNYSGALNIYNLPLSLMAAITASVIPAVSAARIKKDRRAASRITGSAMRITALLAFPMGVGLFVLGTPIISLLFPTLDCAVAGPLLSTLGIASVFVCLMLVCNSILQAYGFVNLPVFIMLLGGVVKIVTNYNLVGNAAIGIAGAPVGNVLCFALVLVLDLIFMARVIPGRPHYAPLFLKPAAAAGVMGLAAWAVYGLGSKLLLSTGMLCVLDGAEAAVELSRVGNGAVTLLAIGVAAIIYGILVLVLHAIAKEDLLLMPKGEKIAKILHL